MGFDKVNQKIPSEHLPSLKPAEELSKSYPGSKITSMFQMIKGQNLHGFHQDYHYDFQALEIISYPGDILSFLSSHPRIKIAKRNQMEQIINTRMGFQRVKQDKKNQVEEILRNLPEILRDAAREEAILNAEGNPLNEEEIEILVKDFSSFFTAYLEKHEEIEKKKETVEHKDKKVKKETINHPREKKVEGRQVEGFPISEEKIAMFQLLYLRLVENRRNEERKQDDIREKETLHRHAIAQEIKKDEIKKDEIRKETL